MSSDLKDSLGLLFAYTVLALIEGAYFTVAFLVVWPFLLREWIKRKLEPKPKYRGTVRPTVPLR